MAEPLPASTIRQAGELLRSGQLTCAGLTEAVLTRIDALDPQLHCYGTVAARRARRQAEALDALLAAGVDLGPVHGIPIAIKDCIDTAGIRTTGGSLVDRDRVPTEDADAVRRLQAGGAIIVGKANLYEWAFGAPSTLWGEVGNPWDPTHFAGASSNGSAAAVAAGLALGALGTDTGGSIRVPAALCGVFGLKPTLGRVSRRGVTPRGATLDHVGPMARTAEDAALLLQAIAGHDPGDPHTHGRPPSADYLATIHRGVDGMRLGIPAPQAHEVFDDHVSAAWQQVRDTFADLGCGLVEVELPDLLDARTLMWGITAPEIAEFHRAHLREQPDDCNPRVKELLEIGEFIPATEYIHCQRVRQRFMDQMSEVFTAVDAVLTVSLPVSPWPSHQEEFELGGTIEDKMSMLTRYTPLFNLTGHPAASVLAGFTDSGLPLAFQIAAPLFDEASIFRLAQAFERQMGYHSRQPVLASLPAGLQPTSRPAARGAGPSEEEAHGSRTH